MSDEESKFKPAFLDKERAESIGYISGDASPQFDTELAALPELTSDLPVRGKGPSPGYADRWREIARLHALGYTNNQIARHLGYSPTGISLALQRPFVQDEIDRVRSQYYSHDAVSVIKDAALDGARRIHKIILDPNTKESTALAAGQWAVEKATGKAKQEVSVESGTFSAFMDLLNQMKDRDEPLDVTPQPPEGGAAVTGDEGRPDWDAWIRENVK